MPDWAANPYQCINYVSCHDNHTLFDRIALTAPQASVSDRIRMNRLAAAFSILSQGVPFFQAGEEMLRSKPDGQGGYDENSYRSSDHVNAIRWDDLAKPEYRKTVDYYRGLIQFRNAHRSLRLRLRDDVIDTVKMIPHANPQVITFHVLDEKQDIFLIFNASSDIVTSSLPSGYWDVVIQNETAGTDILAKANTSVETAPISATVLIQNRV